MDNCSTLSDDVSALLLLSELEAAAFSSDEVPVLPSPSEICPAAVSFSEV